MEIFKKNIIQYIKPLLLNLFYIFFNYNKKLFKIIYTVIACKRSNILDFLTLKFNILIIKIDIQWLTKLWNHVFKIIIF